MRVRWKHKYNSVECVINMKQNYHQFMFISQVSELSKALEEVGHLGRQKRYFVFFSEG